MTAEDLTQRELAARMGKPQSWLSHRLQGRTAWTVDDVELIAEAGVPVTISAWIPYTAGEDQ